VQALESAHPDNSPREILAMLRQFYYGRPWSKRTTAQWEDVLPESPEMPDPRSGPSADLYRALRKSQVVENTDLGHLFAGLEALLHPTRYVEFRIPGPNYVVEMPNTEFANWGGDLGSAAGQAVADQEMRPPARSDDYYFATRVSPADMAGNIDAFVIHAAARELGGLESILGEGDRSANGRPLSAILTDYYLMPEGPLGRARGARYRVYLNCIGATVVGRTIANRADLLMPMARRVSSFALLWYANQLQEEALPVLGHAGAALALHAPEAELLSRLREKSALMVEFFFDWLQARL
jgi:hypothetical protein